MQDPPQPPPADHTVDQPRALPPGAARDDTLGVTSGRLGEYVLVRELGRGGMGVVYLAHDPRLERDVALKMLPPELDADPGMRERFLAEARTLATLNHPNIATIHSLERSGDRHFLTMEVVEGRSLSERLREGVPPLDETLALMRQVTRAVEAAHAKGIVHRDLKPSNVMVQPGGTAKVLDFGIAMRVAAGALAPGPVVAGGRGSTSGSGLGTPGYMSPEQVRGEPEGPSTDVWAIGCMLYEALSGRRLFGGRSVHEKLAATLAFDEASLPEHGADGLALPARIVRLLRHCLATNVADRCATMREVRLHLEEEMAERALPRALEPARQHAPGESPAGNVPRRLSRFIGRDHDLEQLTQLLDQHRMITITGTGGCGKTRLALELAGGMRARCADGVWLVELASLADPSWVPGTVATALGVQSAPGVPVWEALLQFLRNRALLLVLDNCEHLVDACADLVARIVAGTAQTRVLATSRESLRIAGEAVYALAPLALAAGAPGTPAGEECDAVRLFVDRARLVAPAFQLTEATRPAVHEICRRLDGIPLAIELAAARVKLLPVEKIRELLDDRFRLLTQGSRGAPPHQATLRTLLDWSYDRLDAREQAVFRRLAVFRGVWTLDAVEAVALGADVEPCDALDVFTQLAEKSLVVRDAAGRDVDAARFHMYETVRAYAREKLAASGDEEADALRRYRAYIVALSIEGEQGMRGRDQVRWTARLADVVDDVRAVLALAAADPAGAEDALALTGSFWFFWFTRGMWHEGSAAVARALAHPGADPASRSYGRALVAAGNLAYRQGDLDAAWDFQTRALGVLAGAGTDIQVGSVHLNLGNIAFSRGEYDAAGLAWERSLALYRRADATVWVAGCLTNLSALAVAREDVETIETMQSEALGIYEAAGIHDQICLSLLHLGIAAYVRGDLALCRARWERALALAREIGNGWNAMGALENLAFLELGCGRLAEARALLLACMDYLTDMRDPAIALPVCEAVAGVAAGTQPAEASRLLAAATELRTRLSMPLLSYESASLAALRTRLAALLGQAAWERAHAAGTRLSLDEALSLAQALLDSPG